VSQLPAALRRPQKTKMPLDFPSMYLADFAIFNNFSPHPSPKPFAAMPLLPAALRLPQKNTHQDFWSVYLVDVVIF